MGGRVAEEIVFGDITNGARGDIKMATAIARRMVCEWGMSEKMGMVEYGDHEDYVFLGRDISRARDYSEATAEQIDQEVKKAPRRRVSTGEENAPCASRQARGHRKGVAGIRNARRLAT
jgi:ATP-dependent Zn protease